MHLRMEALPQALFTSLSVKTAVKRAAAHNLRQEG